MAAAQFLAQNVPTSSQLRTAWSSSNLGENLMNVCVAAIVALIAPLSLCLTPASAQSQAHAVIITGEVHNPPSQEIEFRHEPLLAPGPSQHHIILDEQNRFALLLNIPKGIFVTGHYKDEHSIPFFVEPGDSLHAVVTFAEVAEADSAATESDHSHSAVSSYSLTFNGRGAENNRFLAEFWPQHSAFEPDYVLEPEEFARQVKQRRQDEFALLAEGREEYALSPGFIDCMTAFFNYKWAEQMTAYPLLSFRNGVLSRSANADPDRRRAVPPDYYDFLQEIPLIDEKAIGVGEYLRFLVNILALEAKSDGSSLRLSDMYKLSGLGLSESVRTRLDSMYDANRELRLSQMVALSGLGLSESAQAQLDSMYADPKETSASEKAAWLGLELSPAALAELDSYEDYSVFLGDTTKTDTTGGRLTFHMPSAKIRDWYDYLNNRPLSARVDLSSLELSPTAQTQLDSMFQNRKPLKLSQRIDLAALDLSPATQAQLDTIFARPSFPFSPGAAERYDLAKQKLQGRVLYWFLAGELRNGIRHGLEAYVDARWQSFEASNPFPEYTEALQAEMNKTLVLQPGQPAPDFTLSDPDGQPISLSQFKGKVVLMDFWASWCGPCIGDLETLRKIKEQVAAQPVVFLNVSLDANDGAWKRAIAKHQIQGVHVRSEQVAQAYNVSVIPRYYLVDPQGLIVEERLSVRDIDEVVAKIEKSL